VIPDVPAPVIKKSLSSCKDERGSFFVAQSMGTLGAGGYKARLIVDLLVLTFHGFAMV
jgi:hypothetical protein